MASRQRVLVAVLALLLVAALSACGGSGKDIAEDTSRDVAAATPAESSTTSSVSTATLGSVGQAPSSGVGEVAVTPAGGGSGPVSTRSPSIYVPPAGTYIYDTTGHIETSGPGGGTKPVPPTSTDEVVVTEDQSSTRVTITTRDEGRDSSQEVVVTVTASEARLVRLTYRPSAAGLGYAVSPDPQAVLARMPYLDGDRWEIAWTDSASGMSGAGTGMVSGRETLTTPAGTFDTVVIAVTQRLRGAMEGTLSVTSWIDPTTGIQVRQHIVTDLRDATGASRTDTTRTLRERRP